MILPPEVRLMTELMASPKPAIPVTANREIDVSMIPSSILCRTVRMSDTSDPEVPSMKMWRSMMPCRSKSPKVPAGIPAKALMIAPSAARSTAPATSAGTGTRQVMCVYPYSSGVTEVLMIDRGTPRFSATGPTTALRPARRSSDRSVPTTLMPGTSEVTARIVCIWPIGPAAPTMAILSPTRRSPVSGIHA